MSDSHVNVEMVTQRPKSSDSDAPPIVEEQRYADWEGTLRRNSTGHRESGGGLRKRFGSLRRN